MKQNSKSNERLPLITDYDLRDRSITNLELRDRSLASNAASEEMFVQSHGLQNAEKTIGVFGSFCLIANNISGPGMMGLPHVVSQAGLIPSIVVIAWVCLTASLCGSLLADSISSIPGNLDFTQQIEFSTAFQILGGEDWYFFAESFFVVSCLVQACAGIVETAQSIDSFVASFLIGKTYAVQLYPSVEILTWSSDSCNLNSSVDDCTPFAGNGPLIISLGYLFATALFFHLGRGKLKENIGTQVFSFCFLIFVSLGFFYEFVFIRELQYGVPLFGTSYNQLIGVVLFNFAFAITVPAWLNEKMSNVPVNEVIWGATVFNATLYILIGTLGAAAFNDPKSDMLIYLASNEVSSVTRCFSVLFGIIVIGCGIPIYCVIVKSALYAGRTCGPQGAFFWGAVFPYAVSWTMYQGSWLMDVLNWTGLLINGVVAFVMPLLLAVLCYMAISRASEKRARQDIEWFSSSKEANSNFKLPSFFSFTDNFIWGTVFDMDKSANTKVNRRKSEVELSDYGSFIGIPNEVSDTVAALQALAKRGDKNAVLSSSQELDLIASLKEKDQNESDNISPNFAQYVTVDNVKQGLLNSQNGIISNSDLKRSIACTVPVPSTNEITEIGLRFSTDAPVGDVAPLFEENILLTQSINNFKSSLGNIREQGYLQDCTLSIADYTESEKEHDGTAFDRNSSSSSTCHNSEHSSSVNGDVLDANSEALLGVFIKTKDESEEAGGQKSRRGSGSVLNDPEESGGAKSRRGSGTHFSASTERYIKRRSANKAIILRTLAGSSVFPHVNSEYIEAPIEEELICEGSVFPIPNCLIPYRRSIVALLLLVVSILILLCIGRNLYSALD